MLGKLMFWNKSRWHAVAKVGELNPGDLVPVTVGRVEIALGRDGDRYFAVQRRCLHRQTDLTEGYIADNQLVCPMHNWKYSTATGDRRDAPGGCLQVYNVRIIGDQIEVDPSPTKR